MTRVLGEARQVLSTFGFLKSLDCSILESVQRVPGREGDQETIHFLQTSRRVSDEDEQTLAWRHALPTGFAGLPRAALPHDTAGVGCGRSTA